MKKVLIADLIKASYDEFKDERDLAIKEIMDKWDISYSEAEYLYENYPNEADQRQVLEAAEALGIGIEDVEDDDVEAMSKIWDMGGSRGYVEIDSDMGKGFIYYAKEYGWALLLLFDKGNPANYPIDEDMARELTIGSLGKSYNEQMRNNPEYSDKPGSWGCIGSDSDSPKRLGNASDFAKLPKDLQEYLTRYLP
jgi:hypothetical protein